MEGVTRLEGWSNWSMEKETSYGQMAKAEGWPEAEGWPDKRGGQMRGRRTEGGLIVEGKCEG
jgi:hypothetical protein